MNIDEILDVMDDLLEKSWGLPLSGGKCVVSAEKFRELIDEIRLNMPSEIKQAKLIVSDRQDILKTAKTEANDMIQKAEDRVRSMVNGDEITKQAQAKANEILTLAQQKSREMKQAASEFSENLMRVTEECLVENLKQVKAAREVVRKGGRAPSGQA